MTNEELSLKTKQKLSDALKKTMTTKPLSKITVTELCLECHINRKTFYYHFVDIYDLLKWMLEQEAIVVVEQFDLIADTEETLLFIMDYVDQNKHIINGAYDSMGYEEIKRFFYTDLFSIIFKAIDQGEKELNIMIDPQFKEFLTAFYTEASAGILIDWTKNRMTQNRETVLKNLLFIYKTSIPAILKAQISNQRL